MALTTLAENKTYMGITDTSQDTIIEIIRPAIEQAIINYCECKFESTVVTNELHDGQKNDVIVPKNFPLISVQAVIVFVDADGAGGSALTPKDYSFTENAIVLRTMHTPFARSCVRIDYTHGFASVPSDVKLAVFEGVKAKMQRRKRNAEDIASRSKGDESESYNAAWDKKSGLPQHVVGMIQAYRAYEFPNIGMAQRNS